MDDIPILPIVYAHRLVELMNEEKLNTDTLLREAGINPKLMSRPNSMLTPRQANALFRCYSGLSSHTLPALRFGQSLDLIAHGLMGHVYMWQGEFRALMESIVAYLRVRFPLMSIEMGDGRGYFGIRLACRISGEIEGFLVQTFIGSLHTLCSPVARNIVIHCRHDLFDEPGAARALLKCELNSDHDCNEIRFYASAVARSGDPDTALAQVDATKQDPFEDTGFVVRLRNHLLSHLNGRDSAENIASSMGMSVRTLRRRLADCGISFNTTRLDVRMSVAMRYLTTTSLSIERIAGFVGYSDQASFTRAFREWKGETPKAIRQQQLQRLHPSSGPGDGDPLTPGPGAPPAP
jgi:AraC-like DNA-binding protein